MSDHQHHAHRPPPDGCGWEDAAGVPVAVRIVEPPPDLADACPTCRRAYTDEKATDAPPQRDYGSLFGLLIAGAPDATTVHRRVLALGYMLHAPGAPRSLAELGLALGITKQAAAKWLTQFRAILPAIAREMGLDG